MAANLNQALPFFANVIKSYHPEPNEEVEQSLQVAVEEHEFVIVDQIKRVFGKWYQVLSQYNDKKGWVPAEYVRRIKCVTTEQDWENIPAETTEDLRKQAVAWAILRRKQQDHAWRTLEKADHSAHPPTDIKKAEAEALELLAHAEHSLKKSSTATASSSRSPTKSSSADQNPPHVDKKESVLTIHTSSSPSVSAASTPVPISVTNPSPVLSATDASVSGVPGLPLDGARAVSPAKVGGPSGPAGNTRTVSDADATRPLSPGSQSRKEMLEKSVEDSKRADAIAAVARDEWQQKQKQLADKITADTVGAGGEKIKSADDQLSVTFASLRKRIDDIKPSDELAAEFEDLERILAATEPQLVAFNDEINALPWSLKKAYRDKLRDFRQWKTDLEPMIVSAKTKFKLI